MFKKLDRRAYLFDLTAAHDDNSVGQGHSLNLVVGDVDYRRTNLLVQSFDLGTHRISQLGIEIGKGFVEEKHR